MDSQAPQPSPGLRGGRRVLVVDDDSLVRQTLVQMLGLLGYIAVEAEDGEAAVRRVEVEGSQWDLLLLDHSLPVLSAEEVLGRLRALGVSCPVVLISGFPEDEARQGLEDFSIHAFLQKPFKMEQLRMTLEAVLES